ncbi:MAG: glycosyltransferase, partial [Planctomycetes bacterium]|nr:glycosyltransferase [Planctomycetota bacterium]
IGRALQARGNEVLLCTSGYYESMAGRAGLAFRAIGTAEDFRRVTADPDLWHPRRAFGAVVRHGMEPGYARSLEIARELHAPGRTVLVAGTLGLAARNAAELLDAPLVSVHLAPSIFFSVDKPPRYPGMLWWRGMPRWLTRLQYWVADRMTDATVLPGLNRFRAQHGLGPARRIVRRWWHAPARVIGLFPPWFAPPQPDWPPQVRLTGFPLYDEAGVQPLPDGLAGFLDAGDAPLVFTPGSAMAHGRKFFAQAVKACGLLGRRGILLSQFPETIPRDLPATVRHFSYVPFSRVFPRAAALVSHGGIGTTAQALRAGIPHLVMHMAHDQLDNAQRLVELGVGDSIAAARFTAPRAARKLAALLDSPDVAARCRELAARFEPDQWMQSTCEWIEQAAR